MTLLEVLREARVPFAEEGHHHHARAGWVQLRDCPWCGSQSYHLGINLKSKACACWRCGVQSGYATLLKLKVDPALVKQALAGRQWTRPDVAMQRKLKEPTPRGPLLPAHTRYLRKRGFIPEEIVIHWKVQAWKWRLYIPVEADGQVASWTSRAIVDNEGVQRYLAASPEKDGGYNIKSLVYGLDNCLLSVIIVEGPTDAWAVGPGAAATLGTAFTPAQVEQLAAIPYRFVCYDAEPQAQRKATELCRTLSLFPGETSNVVLDAEDPGSAPPLELRLLRKMARL